MGVRARAERRLSQPGEAPPAARPAWRRHAPWLAASVAALPFAASSFALPFGRDQGIYSYAADRWLHGHALYRDIYVFKPPLTVVVHGAALALFGHSMLAIRGLDVLWTLATIAALYHFVIRTTKSPLWAYLSAICWAYSYHRMGWWSSAQTDGWANLPIATAFLLATPPEDGDDRPRPLAHLGAGAALGVAFMFKYTFALFAPWVVLLPLALRRRRGISDAALVVAGGALAVAAVIAWLWVAGSLPEFIATQRDVTLPYSTLEKPRSLSSRLSLLASRLGNLDAPGLVGAGLTIPLVAWRAARSPERRTAWRWFGATALYWSAMAIASGWVQKKMFPYHFLPALAPMCVLAGGAASEAAERLAARTGRAWVRTAAAGVITVTLLALPAMSERFRVLGRVATGQTTLDRHWRAANQHTSDTSTRTSLELADWLREHTQPDDPVFLWGYDPLVYFLADRDLVSRFPYTYPLVVDFAPKQYREELMAALNDRPPVVFGVASHDATPAVMGHRKDSAQTLKEFRRLTRFVDDRYVAVAKIGNWRVFVRRDRAEGFAPLPEAPPEPESKDTTPPAEPDLP